MKRWYYLYESVGRALYMMMFSNVPLDISISPQSRHFKKTITIIAKNFI